MFKNNKTAGFSIPIFFLFLFIGVISCSDRNTAKNSPQTLRERTALNIGISVLKKSLDPIDAHHYLHFITIAPTLQTLVRMDRNGKIISDLAKRWSIEENNKQYTFQLDETAYFQDGTRVTAEDVAYSFARHLWKGSPSIIRSYLAEVLLGAEELVPEQIPEGIVVKGPNTIIFKLKKPYPPFIMLLTMPGYGIIKKHAENRIPPIGSGPFMSVFLKNEKILKLVPNPFFRKEIMNFTEINIIHVQTKGELQRLLDDNKIDLALGFTYPDLNLNDIPKEYSFEKLENHGTLHLYTNHFKSIFKNGELRKDLASLIQLAVKEVDPPGFFVDHMNHFIPPGIMPHAYYKKTIPPMDAEVFRKKWQQTINNRGLSIYWREEFTNPKIIQGLEATLTAAGIDAKIISKNYAEMLPILDSGNYDMVLMGYAGVLSDPDGFLDPLRKDSALHFGVMPSESFLKRIGEVRFTENKEERLRKYSEILNDFEKQKFMIPLFRVYLPAIVHKKMILPNTKYRFDLSLLDVERKEV